MNKFSINHKSGNKKIGVMPATITDRESCPDACPLKRQQLENGDTDLRGCYGDNFPMFMHWDRTTEQGNNLEHLIGEISKIPAGAIWRHNQVGDLPGINNEIDHGALGAIVAANTGKRGFTYTHKPLLNNKYAKGNLKAVKAANRGGFTINASSNNLEHADELVKLGLPVVAIIPEGLPKVNYTPKGHKVVTCPAQLASKDKPVKCAQCKLCTQANRDFIVGFIAHGNGKKRVLENTQKEIIS